MKYSVVVVAAVMLAACEAEPERPVEAALPADHPTIGETGDDWQEVERAMGLDRAAGTTGDAQAPPVEQLIEGLEQRARAHRDNVDDWILLAQSYAHVGRMDEAAAALERAVELGADEAQVREQVRQALTASAR